MSKSIADLTEPQLECLALVAQFKTSKQIARELGLSSHAIDARVKRILATLGVASREEAARLYLNHVRLPYQSLVCPSSDIDAARPRGETDLANAPLGGASAGTVGTLRDSAIGSPQARSDWIIALPFQTQGRPDNDMPAIARMTWMVIILLAVTIAVSLLINMSEGLTRLI